MAAFDVQPINYQISIVDEKGRMSMQFQIFLQNLIKQLKGKFGELDAALLEQALIDVAEATVVAQGAADAANGAAATAQGAAETAAATQALASSGTTDLTLTAADVGANVTITISSHNRVYGDGTTVAVNGASLTGRAYNTTYYIYYSDPARTGGTVTYQTSTDPNDAIQTGNIHSVGEVLTPIAADPPQNGYPYPAPGIIVKRE